MAESLALIVLAGLMADAVFRRLRLPGLVGMLLAGVLVGPHVLDLLAPDMMRVSADFRMIALIVILLRAGFELRRDTLHRVGRPALVMSALPAVFEMAAVTLLAPPLLGLGWLEAALLGCILGAVSPAVVVPLMIGFMERGKGEDKGLPTLVLAASSIDDVFVIVVFTIFLGMAAGGEVNLAWQLAGIPLSVCLGVAAGLVPGYLLYRLFLRYDLRPPRRTIIVLGVAVGLMWLEHGLRGVVPVAGLLGVMAIGFIILEKEEAIAHQISARLRKLWVFAELLLFVLVGAQVDLQVAWQAGLMGAAVIAAGLAARSLGTWLSLAGAGLTGAERLFAVVAYLPKATVQAAIGAAPLAAGVAGGEVILAVAVLSIVLTAPVGAVGIKLVGERVLAEGRRPSRRFRDLRERLGLPRVGQRVRSKAGGGVWKVIEEREAWQETQEPGGTPEPVVHLRLWRPGGGRPPGTGPTRTESFTSRGPVFQAGWEILYD
jgi:NhaP-type Na+/H+ or K+/H+ antiporter